MKVLVTGSEGMIGTAVVEVLQDDGNAEDTANDIMAVNLLGTWHVLTAAADDISSASRTSREMAQSLHPDVEWRGGQEYDQQPYKALINNEVLNWMPRYKWRPQDTNTMSL